MNTARTEITCNCKVCKANGGNLKATIPTDTLTALGNTAKTRHGLVYSAHDKTFVGTATRKSLNLQAA